MSIQEKIIYDLETFPNFHSFCGYSTSYGTYYEFYLYDDRKQWLEYINFLSYLMSNKVILIGFNNIGYDYPLLHHIIRDSKYLATKPIEGITKSIYKLSQNTIRNPYPVIDKPMIEQIDLFRIHHFNNKAKRTSLKDVECSIDHYNVEDLPKKFYERVESDEIGKIMKYNRNDVDATLKLYTLTLPNLQLRKELSDEYSIDLMNADDPKIGTEIFAKIICDDLKISRYDLDKMRTYVRSIAFNDIIFPNIYFKTEEFSDVLKMFKSTVIENTKGEFNISKHIRGLTLVYGSGGIHSENKPAIYRSTERVKLIDADITSMYPNLGIQYKRYPRHLSEAFCTIYESVFKKRNFAKKNGNKAVDAGLKLALNGTYGKSNDKYSFFYDPLYTMSITINGQLLISMLIEKLMLKGFEIFMANTDGITAMVPVEKEEEYYSICREWEIESKLQLEYAEYDLMVMASVNDYIAYNKSTNKAKYKGDFLYVRELHKDPSFRIVPIALSEYFIKGVPVEDVIHNFPYNYDLFDGKNGKKDTTIYLYMGREKCINGAKLYEYYIDGSDLIKNELTKTTRYYVSKKGNKFIKVLPPLEKNLKDNLEEQKSKGQTNIFDLIEDVVDISNVEREVEIQSERLCTKSNYVNESKPFDSYDFDFNFYINECNKIIKKIESNE